MIAPVVLFIFALVFAFVGPRALRGSSWLERSPRVGIAAWQALSVSLLATVVLVGVSLAVPAISWTTNLAEFFRACAMILRAQYSTPGGAIVSATGAAAALTVLTRVGYCITREFLGASRSSKRQSHALSLVAEHHDGYNALIVEHTAAAAYCLPGRGPKIVLTTAAIEALDHQHLILAAANALQRAFPGVAAFRHARQALGSLVEMTADDTAVRENDRLTVATALVRLGERGIIPAAALGAGDVSALTRVRRLLSPERPLGIHRTVIATFATGALLALPLFLAIAPASAANTMPPCPADNTLSTM